MEFANIYTIITLALSLGFVHALDADHIMAVSALTSSSKNPRDSIRFCLRWAIGHSATIILIGGCVFLLGMAIPDQLSRFAEHIVGGVLILIGFYVIYTLRQKKLHVHYHEHDGLPKHAHWHSHSASTQKQRHHQPHNKIPHKHRHSAVMVGILHGAAGSAPLLVLIPIARLSNPIYGVVYLVVFSIGVLVCMAIFGGILGIVYQWFESRGQHIINLVRITVASITIVVGGLLLAGV